MGHSPNWQRIERIELTSDTRSIEMTLDVCDTQVLASVRSTSPGPDQRAYVLLDPERSRLERSPNLPSTWHMLAGLPPVRWGQHDAFVALTRHAGDLLFPYIAKGELPKRTKEQRRQRKLAGKESMRVVYGLAKRAAVLATQGIDPKLRSAVLRFPPRLRWQLYTWLKQDDTGRFGQLMVTRPGLASALAQFEDHWVMHSIARKLVREVQEGETVNRLTRKLVDHWFECLTAIGDVGHFDELLFELATCGTAQETRRMRLRKNILLRRAGPRVDPKLHLLPPPSNMHAPDIPTAARANARWYTMMHASPLLLGRVAPEREASAAGVADFLSKNALTITQGQSLKEGRNTVRQLARFCVHAGRVPGRKTHPKKLMRRFRRAEAMRRQFADELPEGWDPANLEHKLPAPFVPGFRGAGVRVDPIKTTGELDREAKLMHHCVRTRLGPVLSGVSSLYSAKVGAERVTIELARETGERIRVKQMAGVCNAEVSWSARRKLDEWLRESGIVQSSADETESGHDPNNDEVPF